MLDVVSFEGHTVLLQILKQGVLIVVKATMDIWRPVEVSMTTGGYH